MSQEPSILDDYRTLSLPARMAVGIHCFQGYCRAKGLRHPLIDAFIDHIWELPCATSFPEWESHRCELVAVGLGAPFPPEMVDLLATVGVTEEKFRELVQSTVEIIYSSAYAASDDAGSLGELERVLRIASEARAAPPPAKPFLISRFGDRHGWGVKLSAGQRDQWRFGAYDAQQP